MTLSIPPTMILTLPPDAPSPPEWESRQADRADRAVSAASAAALTRTVVLGMAVLLMGVSDLDVVAGDGGRQRSSLPSSSVSRYSASRASTVMMIIPA